MKIIVCIDDNYGILFNNRRVSRDKVVIDNIFEYIQSDYLYITDFSTNLFNDYLDSNRIKIVDEINNDDNYYFIENIDLNSYSEYINKIIIYKWNRVYPSDFKFNLNMDNYNKIEEIEFVGNSHELITREIFIRKDKYYE